MATAVSNSKRIPAVLVLLGALLLLPSWAWGIMAPGPNEEPGSRAIAVDFEQSTHSLTGEWQFQPGDNMLWAASNYNDIDWRTQPVPGRWPKRGYPDSGQFAWYRLTLQLDMISPDYPQQLGIVMGKVMSAYELYAGGQLLGGVGKLPPLSEANYDRKKVFAIPQEAIASNGKLVLAIRVWGGSARGVRNFGAGAYAGEFKIGDYSSLLLSGMVGQIPGLLMAALFIGFGIYHLYLYRRNRQLESYLWFGFLAIDIGIYALTLNQWKYWLGWSFVSYEKIEFGAIYLFPALAIQLLWIMLKQPIHALLRVYQAGFVLAASVVVLAPGMEMHYMTLQGWQMYSIPLVIMAPGLIILKARAGNSEAKTALIGVIIFAATCINDILIDLAGLETDRLLPYGFVAVMLTMAISLANRFTAMLNTLEDEVAQRTADLEAANRQLADAARHDLLTGLLNRRGFIAAAEAETQRTIRSGREFSVVLADVDNFKNFNDLHGHACGDHVLRRVAEMLSRNLRDVDRLGRWGGEEFVFLLPETDADGAGKLAEKLRDSIALNMFEYEGERVGVTLTFGVATHRKGEKLDASIARADTALYRGKECGRNRVMVGNYEGLTLVS